MTTRSSLAAPDTAATGRLHLRNAGARSASAGHRGPDRRHRDQPLVDRRDPVRASRRRGAALHGRRRSLRLLHGRARSGDRRGHLDGDGLCGHGRLGRDQAVVLRAAERRRNLHHRVPPRRAEPRASSASTSAAPAGTTSCPACTSSSRPASAARTSRATRRPDHRRPTAERDWRHEHLHDRTRHRDRSAGRGRVAHDHRTRTDPHLVQRCGGARSATRRGRLTHVPRRHGRPARRRHHGRRRRSAAPLLVPLVLSDRRSRNGRQLDARDVHAHRGRRRANTPARRRNRARPNRHGPTTTSRSSSTSTDTAGRYKETRLRDLFAAGHASSP